MTGYVRKWDCPLCGVEVEGIDWPLDGDEPCELCKGRGAKLSHDHRPPVPVAPTLQFVRHEPRLASAVGHPNVLYAQSVEVGCGCAALLGVRLDTMETTVIAATCDEDGHFEAMKTYTTGMAAVIERRPDGFDIIGTSVRLLSRAFDGNLEM